MTKYKLVTSTLLLLLAFVSILLIAPIAFPIQIIRQKNLKIYFFYLALALDYVGATLLFGTTGRTISAIVWDKQILWAIKGIDRIFFIGHCEKEYKDEKWR